MKRIAWIMLVGVFLVGAAQAAYVELNAPGTITVGQTLEVSGSSLGTLKPGFSTDLIFYKMAFTKTEIAGRGSLSRRAGSSRPASRPPVLMQGTTSWSWSIPCPKGNDAFGGEAKNQLSVILINRQNEITITSSSRPALHRPSLHPGICEHRGEQRYPAQGGP